MSHDDIDELERTINRSDLSGLPPERQGDEKAWQAQIQVLKMEDWDKRVRIGAGNRGGARIGSVRQVPPVGVKLALRKAMLERAEAEIYAIRAGQDLKRLKMKRAVQGLSWFVFGGFTVGALAAAAKLYFG